MSAKATREERTSPGSDPVIATSSTTQHLNTSTKTTRTKRRSSSDSVVTTPTQPTSKKFKSPSPDSGSWKTLESTPSRFPHLQRRKALQFATPSPQQNKSITSDSTPRHYPIEHLTAGKPLTERQQMSLLLQLTSSVSSPMGGSAVVSDVRRRKVKVNWKVHKRNERGETPLHVASIKGDMSAVNRLIRQGAEINSQDHAGWTPLHEAANHGHHSIVAKLLKEGADPNASGMDNDSPLHDAAANSHIDVVQILLENGAVPDRRNMQGERPIDVAMNDSIIQMLKRHTDSVSYSPTQADGSQEVDTSDFWEGECQPFDQSAESQMLDTHNDEDPHFDIIVPHVSPIKSADTSLVDDDKQSYANSLISMEQQNSTQVIEEQSSPDCNLLLKSTKSTALKADNLVCTEEIHLDHPYEQLLPNVDDVQQPSEEFCHEAETSPSLHQSFASNVPDWEDVSVEDDPNTTSQSEVPDTMQGSKEESHENEQQLDKVLSCHLESFINDAQEASELTEECSSECSKEMVPSDCSIMESSEILLDNVEQMPVKRKKQILHSWKHCDEEETNVLPATQPTTQQKQNINFITPPGFEHALTYTRKYTIQAATLQNPEEHFFKSLFPSRDTPESLRMKHRVEREKLLLTFEQQVLYAVDTCHTGPKPVTFCGLLADKEGWHLVQSLSEKETANSNFDMDKYTELLKSIQETYDKATLQLARRQQLELDTVCACSGKQTRMIISDNDKPMSSRETFTIV